MKMVLEEKKGPMMKSKHGGFQVCVWKRTKTFAPKSHEVGYVPERSIDVTRASIQLSRKVGNDWKRQTIWCDPHQLRDLAIALAELNIDDERGTTPSSVVERKEVEA